MIVKNIQHHCYPLQGWLTNKGSHRCFYSINAKTNETLKGTQLSSTIVNPEKLLNVFFSYDMITALQGLKMLIETNNIMVIMSIFLGLYQLWGEKIR